MIKNKNHLQFFRRSADMPPLDERTFEGRSIWQLKTRRQQEVQRSMFHRRLRAFIARMRSLRTCACRRVYYTHGLWVVCSWTLPGTDFGGSIASDSIRYKAKGCAASYTPRLILSFSLALLSSFSPSLFRRWLQKAPFIRIAIEDLPYLSSFSQSVGRLHSENATFDVYADIIYT